MRVRCMEISAQGDAEQGNECSARYEVFIEARGRSAVADVPPEDRQHLSARIDELVGAFVDSLRLAAGESA